MKHLNLSIESFGGITSATLDIPPGLTLVAGANGAGKTTILRAIAAGSGSGTVIPITNMDGKDAIMKKESRLLVRGKSGSVTLAGKKGSCRVVWPSNGNKGTGPFPNNSPSRMALGMIHWMSIPAAARLKTLMAIASKDPTTSTVIIRDDLVKAVAIERINPEVIDWAWQVITNSGFDVAHSEASKKRSETTGAWRAITKETYGATKARDYLPQGWEEDLVSANHQDLQQDIQVAKRAVDRAIANQAVNVSEVAKLEKVAGAILPNLRDLQKSLSAARKTNAPVIGDLQAALSALHKEPQPITNARVAILAANKQVKNLQKQIATIQAGAPQVDGYCPGCETPLSIHDYGPGHQPQRYHFSHPTGAQVDQAQIDALKKEIANLDDAMRQNNTLLSNHTQSVANKQKAIQNDLDRALSTHKQAIREPENKLNQAKRQESEVKTAQSQLAKIKARDHGVSAEALATLRQELTQAEARLKAWEIKNSADRYAEDARQYAVIKAVTATDGLRKTKMDTALVTINVKLAEISGIAKWGPVSLTTDFDLQYMGRPYVICSAAEQYRCRVTMQVMMATLEQAPILLFDGTDILDSSGRLGLVTLLRSTGIPSIIAMTAKRDYTMAVATLFDSTFWVEDGVVSHLSGPVVSPPAPQPEDPELTKFKETLARHDWFYVMADDGRAYKAGEKAHNGLINRAKQGGDDYMSAFNLTYAKAWSGVSSKPVTPVFPGK